MGSLKPEERITKTTENASETRSSGSRRTRRGRWQVAAGLIVLVVAGAGYRYYRLHHETTEAEIAEIESLITAGKNDEARALMVSAQVRSHHVDALRLRIGRAFLREGRLGPATALLSQVEGGLIKEERLALAEYFLGSGDPFSAVRFYEAALSTGMSRSALLLGRLGEARSLSGNREGAAEAFREALLIDPDLLRVRLNLAATLANLGQSGEARSEAANVLKIEPDNEKARQLLDALGAAE